MEIDGKVEPILPNYSWINEFSIRKRATELEGKLIGFRFDINSPVDEQGKVLDNPRISTAATHITRYVKDYRCIPILFPVSGVCS